MRVQYNEYERREQREIERKRREIERREIERREIERREIERREPDLLVTHHILECRATLLFEILIELLH